MAKLYFSYSAMNAGKSTVLLQASHNYGERGMQTMLFTAKLDNRSSVGYITSRIGLSEKALTFENKDNLFNLVEKGNQKEKISCVFIDEAQFLTSNQVWELSEVVEKLKSEIQTLSSGKGDTPIVAISVDVSLEKIKEQVSDAKLNSEVFEGNADEGRFISPCLVVNPPFIPFNPILMQ